MNTGNAQRIRLLLVDDHELVRAGFRLVLRSQPDMELVGEAADGAQAIEVLHAIEADVVLMDVRMTRMNGLEATRLIRADAAAATPKVLILTTFDLDEYAFAAIRAGASGFLLKDVPAADLFSAIRSVHAGGAVVAPTTTRRLLERFAVHLPTDTTKPGPHGLTTREQEVLLHVARGLSNAEIAQHLRLAEATVKTHLNRILAKLDVNGRAQAVVYAYESGLVTPDRPTELPCPHAGRAR
ncbi:response regulator transcription factor [Planotetraspora sp. A-T 1434]|uniref:response regulator n=1 Tax=Planotetraspora sp. A-T 1434 TaxID=2979219 RepID=UPI0021BF163D|nr:response regulator transcription factor [Planotetraspora sp. A-T 1434]MCT9929782.1 response regulator transcription factor [Planotetraspora sp. A-T 1434]